jgi:hypothetical protein
MRTTLHPVGDARSTPGDIVDDLTDAARRLLPTARCSSAQGSRGFIHSLAKFRRRSWNEPHRKSRADGRPSQEANQEAVPSSLRVFGHGRTAHLVT